MTLTRDVVGRLLDDLRSLTPPDDGPVLDELQRRLSQRVLRVLVAGEAKRGKSTLLNALLGRDVLPTGVVPVTAVATTVRSGPVEQVVARFRDGTVRTLPLSGLAELVTERGNPANERGVMAVEVQLPLPLLDGLELVDTPGVGSVHEHNTAEAETALRTMDAAIFVLTVDPPVSASERAFLRQVSTQAVRLFCVLNKVDRLDAAERAEALAFTAEVLAGEFGAEATVFPLSARDHRTAAGGDPGFRRFTGEFLAYLRDDAGVDLRRSVAAHAARLARSVAETQEATLAALAISDHDLTGRIERFRDAAAAVGQERAETAAVASAEFRRLRNDTDIQAAELVRSARPELLRAAAERVSVADGSAAAIEADALDFVAHRIREIIDPWRTGRSVQLEAAVRALDARLTERLTADIKAVRGAATDLLDMSMPPLPVPPRLASTGAFGYSFAADPGQTELLTTAVRSRLPSRLARRRIAAYVADRADTLLDRHVGRCAAAFRQQLAETQRGFLRAMDRRYAEGADRIAEAIYAAADLRALHRPEVERVRESATSTLAEARKIFAEAEQLAGPPVAVPDPRGHREPTPA